MIKQILAVTAIVGMMAGTAVAQTGGGGTGGGGTGSSSDGGGSQNLNQNAPTGGGVGPTGRDQAPMYRDSSGNPCTAGSAGCSRVEGTMKK